MEDKNNGIELRSEKVRNFVGKVPPRLQRIGILLISLIILLVLFFAYFVPYPRYMHVAIKLHSIPQIQTIKATESGVFFAYVNDTIISEGQILCSLKNRKDSVVTFSSDLPGKVILNVDNNSHVNKGDILLSILPDTLCSFYGISFIPTGEINIISKGQNVSVVYDNGSITGEVSKIYPIPEMGDIIDGNYFKVKIEFTESLNNLEKCILLPNYINSAKILLSDKPLLRQILNLK